MVYIYLCHPCEEGNHAHCEIGTPMAKGCVSGGSKCRCPCHGDPDYNNPARISKEMQKLVKDIMDFEQSHKRIKNVTQEVFPSVPSCGED